MITSRDLDLLGDGLILADAGHFPAEIDVDGLSADDRVVDRVQGTEGVSMWGLADGRRIYLLGDGHMVNLAGPRPLGNSIESMDLGFALQARSLEAIALGTVGRESRVVPVPPEIDGRVADAYVELARLRPRRSPG